MIPVLVAQARSTRSAMVLKHRRYNIEKGAPSARLFIAETQFSSLHSKVNFHGNDRNTVARSKLPFADCIFCGASQQTVSVCGLSIGDLAFCIYSHLNTDRSGDLHALG